MAVALLEDRSKKGGHVESGACGAFKSGIPALCLDSSGLRTKEDEELPGWRVLNVRIKEPTLYSIGKKTN